MAYYVYKITNLINDKIYIGKASDIRKRWNAHKTAARLQDPKDFTIIHRALRKYGFDNFQIEELSNHETEKEALEQEIYIIEKLQSRNRNVGYNITAGGEGTTGLKLSQESKNKMRKAKKDKFIGEKNPFYGKHHSKKTKNLISEVVKQNNLDGKYHKSNLEQCHFSIEKCLDIQQDYLTEKYTFEELSNKYNTNLHTIYNIIHGTYYAIQNKSIISENMIQQIKHKRNQKPFKFSIEQELNIVNEYEWGILIKNLAIKYNTSAPTIRKILKRHNIVIRRRFCS